METHRLWRNNDFYIAGESYGGHYVPSLAYYIIENRENEMMGGLPRLVGIAIGDGFTDPETQVLQKPNSAYEFGLLSIQTLTQARALAEEASKLARDGHYHKAHVVRTAMETLVTNFSGINPYDVREFGDYDWSAISVYMNAPTTKSLLKIPSNVSYGTDADVATALDNDIMRSNAWKFPVLLSNLKVMLYQGQFDWKDGCVSNEGWLNALKWSGSEVYSRSRRFIWGRGKTNFGWVKSAKAVNLTEVVVAGAGHMVPMNQPMAALDMITRFIKNERWLER